MQYENDNEYSHYNYRPSDETILSILADIENEVLREHLHLKGNKKGNIRTSYLTNSKAKIQVYNLYCGNTLLGTMQYGYVPVSYNVGYSDLIEAVKAMQENNDFKNALFFKATFISAHLFN